MLSGNVPCSQAQRTHSRTAIGWRSTELVSKLFDTLLYIKQEGQCPHKLTMLCICITTNAMETQQ